jgi:hypothetical protein
MLHAMHLLYLEITEQYGQQIHNKFCPPDDAVVRYTTTYTLHPQDGQQYLVFTDYHLDLVPSNLTAELENLFNGNKFLGKLTVAHCKI